MTQIEKLLLTPCEAVASSSKTNPLDAVVVGGGPTGITSARTLVEAGLRTAIIEAGPLAVLTHTLSTDLRHNGGSVRALQRSLSYSPKHSSGNAFGALVACLGGRGVFWNGAAPRYLEKDFEGWPLTYGDLEPYYLWAEREMFVSNAWGQTRLASAVCRMLRLAGINAEPEPFSVDSRESVDGWLSGTVGNPMTQLLRTGFLAPDIERRLFVCANALALLVQRSQDSKFLELIVKDNLTGNEHIIAARSIVLAAGGFESVRIALSSKLPDTSGLMGRRLMDHWFVRGYFPVASEIYDSSRPEAGAILVRPTDGQPFQIEVHLPARLFFHAHANFKWQPVSTEMYSAMIRAFAPTRSVETNYLEVTNPGSAGGYVVHMDITDADASLREQMVNGIKRVRDALRASDATIEQQPLGASYHEAGGLPMSNNAATGVVDAFGRFFGEPNIVVADASAWPSIGCANPHLTLVALARRQASHLANALKG